jgi:S-adenosylmethionine:tRNA ribosyltransferase-isomerase
LRVEAFDFDLPSENIAQFPAARRDGSRLLRLHRSTGVAEHHRFDELPQMLRAGDLLVINDTRVLPAQLIGRKGSGGRVELLLLEREGASAIWKALMKCSRKPRPGDPLSFDHGLRATVVQRCGEEWRIEFEGGSSVEQRVRAAGRPPLPPYIRRDAASPGDAQDADRYQTVYAARDGAIAAPTAGLHFTPSLLETLDQRGVGLAAVTLHVGRGTFLPVTVERVESHRMHEEWCEVPAETADAIRRTRHVGGRVIAVGTTVVRTLESQADAQGDVQSGAQRSSIFIYPGYRFRTIDALITNFHLPRSTLLMLVSAFAGRERVLQAYREAVRLGYRFYSYGDAMLIEEFA